MGGNHFVSNSKVIQCENVLSGSAFKGVKILDGKNILDELELVAGLVIHQPLEMTLVEQIVDALFVHLQVGAVDGILLAAQRILLFYQLKKQLDGARHDTFVF